MDEEEGDVASFGSQIGRRMAAAKLSVMQPSVAVRVFVDALLGEHPNAKLPELIADGEVKRWLDRRALGEGQLRQALTAARRALRAKGDEKIVKRPLRRAKPVAATMAPSPVRSVAELTAGAVPNQPLSEL